MSLPLEGETSTQATGKSLSAKYLEEELLNKVQKDEEWAFTDTYRQPHVHLIVPRLYQITKNTSTLSTLLVTRGRVNFYTYD